MIFKLRTISSVASYFKTYYASQKPQKFLAKQVRDIEIFGTNHYRDGNVPAEIIEKYTPFRRLSKKKCTLSAPEYFIEKFEKENKSEIPILWKKMSEAQKVDFIVKNRYEKLVSNKIMNDISKSRVEESFGLTTDGQIRYYGNLHSSRHCPSPEDKNLISIHNHPFQFGNDYSIKEYSTINRGFHPFSQNDILHSIRRPKAYVVDMNGNKYCFVPDKKLQNPFKVDDYINELAVDLDEITSKNINKYANISDAIKYSRVGYINRIKQDGHDIKQLNLFDT